MFDSRRFQCAHRFHRRLAFGFATVVVVTPLGGLPSWTVAMTPRVGTQPLTVSAAWCSSSYHPKPAGGGIGTCLPTFHAAAADQDRVAFMPDTVRPVNGHPPDSSRD